MEVLRRDTLEWEKIKLKGKKSYDFMKLSDGVPINFMNVLAIKGKLNLKGLGYCSSCNRIMTQKEYDKHRIKHASIDACKGCYYFKTDDVKYTKKNGAICMKATMKCARTNAPIISGMECNYYTCSGEFLDLANHLTIPQIRMPIKVITLKKLLDNGWNLNCTKYDGTIELKYKSYNLYARVDKNGYLICFKYNDYNCFYSMERMSLRTEYNHRVTRNETINKICGRLYV